MITVEHLTKSYTHPDGSTVQALRDVSFHVKRGDAVGIIGPSGAGKSTLLRALNLLDPADGGSIKVGGEDIMANGYSSLMLRQKMGMVFQQFNLFKHLSVLDNVMLGPVRVKGMGREEARAIAMDMLRKVGMADRASAMPQSLSGGQQQRAAIARCLAMQPDIILLDEPTSALDPTMVDEVMRVLRQLAEEKMTMLLVSHRFSLVRDVCNRVIYLQDGMVHEEGTTEQIFFSPKRPETRTFVQRIRSLVFDITNRDFDFYDMTSQIKQFCIRYSVPEKMNPVTHVVEEMLLLLEHYDKAVHIEVNHNELTGATRVAVLHCGADVSPLEREDADELAVMIIRGMSRDIQSEQTDEGFKLTFAM